MAKYRKKPVVIEAVQWRGENYAEVLAFAKTLRTGRDEDGSLRIPTLEGVMKAATGDWIIKGVKGEFYPCKPDIFDAIYELESSSGLVQVPLVGKIS